MKSRPTSPAEDAKHKVGSMLDLYRQALLADAHGMRILREAEKKAEEAAARKKSRG